MEDEQKSLFTFPCPACSGLASMTYTKQELEAAIEEGELHVYHINCDHSWKEELKPQQRAVVREALDRLLLLC